MFSILPIHPTAMRKIHHQSQKKMNYYFCIQEELWSHTEWVNIIGKFQYYSKTSQKKCIKGAVKHTSPKNPGKGACRSWRPRRNLNLSPENTSNWDERFNKGFCRQPPKYSSICRTTLVINLRCSSSNHYKIYNHSSLKLNIPHWVLGGFQYRGFSTAFRTTKHTEEIAETIEKEKLSNLKKAS